MSTECIWSQTIFTMPVILQPRELERTLLLQQSVLFRFKYIRCALHIPMTSSDLTVDIYRAAQLFLNALLLLLQACALLSSPLSL